MKILVDADACPVKDVIIRISREFEIEVDMFVSLSNAFRAEPDVNVILVDDQFQAVDMEIYNRCESGDIIVTDDKGLAALILSKDAFAISSRGWIFSEWQIDQMLMERHLAAKHRRAGKKTKGPKAFTKIDRSRFEKKFTQLIDKLYQTGSEARGLNGKRAG